MGKKKRSTALDVYGSDDEKRPPTGPTPLSAFLSIDTAAKLGIPKTVRTQTDVDPQAQPQPSLSAQQGLPRVTGNTTYAVFATKKGAIPVTVEPRRSGKKVVVIANVSGELSALLKDLQAALGTGGVVNGNTVEVQGEHHFDKIQKMLVKSGCVIGASSQVKNDLTDTPKTPTAAHRNPPELRVDSSDGGTYDLDSFVQVYGGTRGEPPQQWLTAERVRVTTTKAAVTTDLASLAPLDPKVVKSMKPPELKQQLAARGASTQGNKKDLITRLLASLTM
eukprot:m.29110 g.29110  ORF g.29110 m.29110 type:complete len:278 (-) comp16041_c0_seq1:59-892(-)